MGFVVGSVIGGVVCGLSRVGCIGALGWVEAGFSWGGGLGEIGSISSIREWGIYAIVGCSVEAMCCWRWDPRFALKYVELIGAWLLPSVAWFTSPADWAGC